MCYERLYSHFTKRFDKEVSFPSSNSTKERGQDGGERHNRPVPIHNDNDIRQGIRDSDPVIAAFQWTTPAHGRVTIAFPVNVAQG